MFPGVEKKLFFEIGKVLCSKNMAVQIKSITITEIVGMLEDRKNKNPKVALLLGSRAGALFRSEGLNEELMFYSTRGFVDMSPWERFSECYNILQQNKEEIGKSDLIAILKHALSGINFSKADISLAELVKQDIFKLIISANIDELLDNAMTTLEMKEGHDFVNFSLASHLIQEETVQDIVFHNKQDACKIIRISDEAKKLVYSLTQPNAQEANSSFVKRLLERLRTREVLVVGFDPLWDAAFLSALPDKVKTVWFVNEDEKAMDQFLAKSHVEQCNCIIGENGSYEKFLMALQWDINKDIPQYYNLLSEVLSRLLSTQSKLNSLESEIVQLKNMVKSLVNSIETLERGKQ